MTSKRGSYAKRLPGNLPFEEVSLAVVWLFLQFVVFWHQRSKTKTRTRSKNRKTETKPKDAWCWYTGQFSINPFCFNRQSVFLRKLKIMIETHFFHQLVFLKNTHSCRKQTSQIVEKKVDWTGQKFAVKANCCLN